MAFNIGDKVIVRSIEFGDSKPRTVTDKFYSEKSGDHCYILDNSGVIYSESELAVLPEAERKFTFQFHIADNVVIALMMADGEEIARGHGHVIHSGEIGIAQAASYALKKLYLEMNGGKM